MNGEPMTREQVLVIVKKYINDVAEDLDTSNIDTSTSMKDMGINSLDIVEVVSCSMRELKIKVPRSELSRLENVDGLVDLLYRAVLDKEHLSAVQN
jgi:acyl carrier protein